MADVKMTKNGLRGQQATIMQLQKYLPTLQLKKALLQNEVTNTRLELTTLNATIEKKLEVVSRFAQLLGQPMAFDVFAYAKPVSIDTHVENLAGIEIEIFDGCSFSSEPYSLLTTPFWVEAAILYVQDVAKTHAQLVLTKKRLLILERELRDITIRLNLFEKRLIPTAMKHIKRIKIFLGDQELSSVSQAKVAKIKILEHKRAQRAAAQ